MLWNIPVYNKWLNQKILSSDGDISLQLQHMEPEQRREFRYGYSYILYKDLENRIGHFSNVRLLLPPNGYLQEMQINDLQAVEPAVLYYYTGINAVTVNSPQARSANWALLVRGLGHIGPSRLKSEGQLDSLLTLYKQYKY